MIIIRNPNGYGTVVKLSGNRRKPYAVRRTAGYNEKGQPVLECLGYFESRKDALMALAEYNSSPYDVKRSKFTLKELYDEWADIILPSLNYSTQKQMEAAFRHCSDLYETQYRNIKRYQMQSVIDNCGLSSATQYTIRNLFMKLDAYAYEMDIISRQYAQLLTVSDTKPVRLHRPFDNDEIQLALQAPEIAFMLYTGMRITEVATLPSACIHDGIFSTASKRKQEKTE